MNLDDFSKDSCNCNFIKESVCKIDKMQKEVVSDTNKCVSCETSLFASMYNTIPVSFYTCCGNQVTANISTTTTTTPYFRIESIRCNRFVTLNLLQQSSETTTPTLTATNYTMILDLDCVGSMQCYEPINVEICTQSQSTT